MAEASENTRIRFYSYFDKYKQETFTGKEDHTLLELRFNEYKAILLETKQPHEVFEDYDPTMWMFKVNTWRPNLTSLDESALKPVQILIHEKATLADLKNLLKTKFGYEDVTVIKGTKFASELLKGDDKSLSSDLKLSNCQNLYVEEAEEQVKWLQEFDMDKYRCTIVFNDPRKGVAHEVPDYNFEIQVDSRKSMLELKQHVADILGLDLEEFILKRGSRFNQEVKDLTKSIRDNGILGRGTLFLSMGKPSA